MATKLHIDIETYSEIDIRSAGLFRYMECPHFEIMLVAFGIDDQPQQIVDLMSGEPLPDIFIDLLEDPTVEKHAHNAAFERNAFRKIGYDIPASQWFCSMVHAAYAGLPLSLGKVSEALDLGDKSKSRTGTALIKYFCCPCKPTRTNGGRTRNLPEHAPEKWEQFKDYCLQDVVAETAIGDSLAPYKPTQLERRHYALDAKINFRGVRIDLPMVENAWDFDKLYRSEQTEILKGITNLENPNSPAQLKVWLSSQLGTAVESLRKEDVKDLIKEAEVGPVKDALQLRLNLSRTSTRKYKAMLSCACDDSRARGLTQFYGAGRTGRWAGRLIQLQNLKRNYLDDLEGAKALVVDNLYDDSKILYGDIADLLSQLIRTALIAPDGYVFAVADFSAIEARVIAWLAAEDWRLEVFKTHGKIYEASASKMFNVPIEEIGKGSDLRAKGKVAELALGYQGGVNALKTMGGERMGLSDQEMDMIVKRWRVANSNIKFLWGELNSAAIKAVKTRRPQKAAGGKVIFDHDGRLMSARLPSGRSLHYYGAQLSKNRFGWTCIRYKGPHPITGKWGWVNTYGGKITENVTQAIARDLLAEAMLAMDKAWYYIVMHVHDEVVIEVPAFGAHQELKKIEKIMGKTPEWAKGLPLGADGYITPFYKKD